MVLVEDCALSLLSETLGRPLGSFGRYATFCLYKTLPVPNGGVLVANDGGLDGLGDLALEPCRVATRAGRTVDLVLEWLRGRAFGPGAAGFAVKRAAGRAMTGLRVPRVPFGDIGFDLGSVNVAVAPLSRMLLDRFDYDEVRRRRRRNFQMLRDRLHGRAALLPLELEDGTCPLIFPLLVPDKPGAARALQADGISAMEFWNGGDPDTRGPDHADAWYLREHLVELPIHQDITPEQIDYMADACWAFGCTSREADRVSPLVSTEPRSSTTSVTVETITEVAAFRDLRDEWTDLLSPGAPPTASSSRGSGSIRGGRISRTAAGSSSWRSGPVES